jgi:hypothetical protein
MEVPTEAERMELMACEEVIASGMATFVQVGLAFATVRDHRLYRFEGATFEGFCRIKCEYSRRYVDQMISAAQVFMYLRANCAQTTPQRESQVRPLVGLSPEQAKVAWEKAIQKAKGRRITAALVRAAVHELKGPAPAKTVKQQPTRAEKRRALDCRIAELLVLLSQKAAHDVLAQKVHDLQASIATLLPTLPAKAKGASI